MKLRELKRILLLLKSLESEITDPSLELVQLITDAELIEIINWSYPEIYKLEELREIERYKLINLISSNKIIVEWTIHHLEKQMTSFPQYTQEAADSFFERTGRPYHYLNSKPIADWDSYDKANYRSLLHKSGSTKRVFAIFSSDVREDEVYAVTTKPTYFFDTKKEAETEITAIVAKGDFTREELVIHALWQLT